MSVAINVAYVYPFPSVLEGHAGQRQLKLATSGGQEQHPYFFRGVLKHPQRTADLLLAVSLVSRTRFYSIAAVHERLLAAADPVVTSGGDRLRFEAFSACCGVYARLDLRPAAIDGEFVGKGTTNVDFNPPMRAALAGILEAERVALHVGADRVELERSAGTVVERQVKLPLRWLKGFVEVQSYQARMQPAMEVPAAELKRVLASVPQQEIWQKGAQVYMVPSGRGVRLSQRATAQAVGVGAPGRLKVLEGLLRHARVVRLYAGPDGVSGWELVANDASLHLILSPDASRGFSGEGQVLSQLAIAGGAGVTAQVRAALHWESRLDANSLAHRLGLERTAVEAALAVLGTRGLVGYDTAEASYFHRELPFDYALVEALQPRLQKARELIADKAVRLERATAELMEAYVRGKDVEHRVVFQGDTERCTCPWYTKHQGARGACRHILAVEILLSQEDAP